MQLEFRKIIKLTLYVVGKHIEHYARVMVVKLVSCGCFVPFIIILPLTVEVNSNMFV